MVERSRLEELSMELPEKERKQLLERIGRRMEQEQGEAPVAVELREEEREKIIAYEMKKANAWVRFMLWLRSLISAKPRKEVFFDIRLRALKTHIRAVSPGITGFETRDLSPRFARKLYDVFLKVQPLMAVYHALGSDKAVRGAAYAWYVEKRFEQAKRSVDDLVGTEEMEEIFAQTGRTEEISRKLALRLSEYVRAIPENLLLKLEEEAGLHLHLGMICSFPFASFFRYFNHVMSEPPEPTYPAFEHAPVMLTLDLMEKLYAMFSLFQRGAPGYPYAEEPLQYYLSLRAGLKPGDEHEAARIGAELARLRNGIMELAREIDAFTRAVPLLDLLRYFRRDPWFQLMFHPPRLFLRSLYFAALKARLGQELEERLGTVKERVIGRKIEELLKGQRIVEFAHYRETPDFDTRKLGLPYFTRIRSLGLVQNYVIQQFKGVVQDAAQIVMQTALANNRILQNRLTQNMSGLEDLAGRIALFDRSLSPDEEDGKQLARFQLNVASDLLVQKSYRAFVVQKDREARDLIDKAKDYLAGVQKIFDDLRTSAFDNARSLLKTLHIYRGRNQTLGQILNQRSESIGALLKLLDQVLEMEKGS